MEKTRKVYQRLGKYTRDENIKYCKMASFNFKDLCKLWKDHKDYSTLLIYIWGVKWLLWISWWISSSADSTAWRSHTLTHFLPFLLTAPGCMSAVYPFRYFRPLGFWPWCFLYSLNSLHSPLCVNSYLSFDIYFKCHIFQEDFPEHTSQHFSFSGQTLKPHGFIIDSFLVIIYVLVCMLNHIMIAIGRKYAADHYLFPKWSIVFLFVLISAFFFSWWQGCLLTIRIFLVPSS